MKYKQYVSHNWCVHIECMGWLAGWSENIYSLVTSNQYPVSTIHFSYVVSCISINYPVEFAGAGCWYFACSLPCNEFQFFICEKASSSIVWFAFFVKMHSRPLFFAATHTHTHTKRREGKRRDIQIGQSMNMPKKRMKQWTQIFLFVYHLSPSDDVMPLLPRGFLEQQRVKENKAQITHN